MSCLINNATTKNSGKSCAVLIATLSSFLTPFMSSSVNIALPTIGKEFGMSAVLLSWVVTSFLLSSAVFLVPFGKIADIYGRKKVFTIGISIYTIASFLSAISTSAFVFIAFRVLQGIGSAMIFGTGVAILTSVVPLGERGRALGINVASVYLGLSFGPFLGGFLTQHFGWRSIFYANIPFGLVVIGMVFWKLKGEWAEARGEKFDLSGSLIYTIGLVATMYGISLLPAFAGLWLIFFGLVGIGLFIVWEMKTENPVLDITLFKDNKVFALSNLAALINYSATFAGGFLLSLYLQYIKGLTPQGAGLILVSQPLTQAIFSPLAGKFSDKVEPRIIASIGMALTVLPLLMFIFLGEGTGLWFIIINLFILGLGLALFSSPNTNAVMGSVEKRDYGIASGILGTMRLVGQMLSMGTTMLIFALYIGKVKITPSYYHLFLRSSRTAFIIFTLLCFGAVFASLARGKVKEVERS